MNWGKAKTILIVFFVIIDMFLLVNIISNKREAVIIKGDTVENTVAALAKNGIRLSKNIIPGTNTEAKQFEADNIIADYDEFAKKTLGESAVKIAEGSYESERGTLTLSGDSFCIAGDTAEEYPKSESEARTLLRNWGIEPGEAKYKDGTFVKCVYGLEVFNSQISIKKTEDGRLGISGVWFEKNSNQLSSAGSMKPITSVLIDFISSPERPEGEVEIIGLEWGYMVYETDSFHRSIVPVPVWRIELSGGESVYMDARNN